MDKERVKEFADKVFGDMAGAMAAGMGFVGVKTGLFAAMAGKGAMTPEALVAVSRLQRRYVEGWLASGNLAGTRRDGRTGVVAVDAGDEALTTVVADARTVSPPCHAPPTWTVPPPPAPLASIAARAPSSIRSPSTSMVPPDVPEAESVPLTATLSQAGPLTFA